MKEKPEQHQNNLRHKGQSLVEWALVLPILLLIIMAAMDFGRMFYTKIILTNAAREGVNYLAYFPEDKDAGYANTISAALNEANGSIVTIDASHLSISDCCTPGAPVGGTASITVNLIFNDALQTLGLLGGPLQLSSTVRMMVQ